MNEVQTPGTEVPTPAVAVENPVAAVAVVPNVSAPAAVVSAPPVGAVAAVGAEVVSEVEKPAQEVATIAKSELAHVFEAFEHASLMEGISRLYALAKKYL
jgi:hypothetical protein